jgi:hypothetical protein
MKTKLILTIMLATICLGINAQQYVIQVKPAGGDLWGYANLKGELLIAVQYTKCTEFSSDGLAAVLNEKTKQYYFINIKGDKLSTEITDFKLISFLGFDVKGFSDGLVAINQGKKWGYLNTSGKVAIPPKYDDANEFSNGYAAVKSGNQYFILNTKGEESAVQGSDILDIKLFTEGLAPFKSINKLYGFMGTDGKIAIQAQFESVGYFNIGLAWAKTNSGVIGYINPKGEWVISAQFSTAKNFDAESGLARIKIGEKWAYVNKTGEIMYVNDAESIGDFSEGLADGKKNSNVGFFNNKGQWVIEPQFDDVREFKNGYAAVKKADKWGLIDKTGKIIIPISFSAIKDVELVK